MSKYLGSIDEERQLRFDSLSKKGVGSKEQFLQILDRHASGLEHARIRMAYDFAINLQYDHVGLDTESYLAHPLRVAAMAIEMVTPLDVDTIIIALLHNCLEVGDTSPSTLRSKFGPTVADSVATLTVERRQQWDKAYKEDYYKGIRSTYQGASVVKVLDKLDNIPVLCLNPDADVRAAYLEEIHHHVIPMAKAALPEVVDFLIAASDSAKKVGHITNP
ncbi:MAG: (p)ppGpp synthase/HD superfamily hydrolase [Kiritimatiellia bacterium]|jgi:(p)ppGpp synthase/HD superfamily hydrolase